MSTKHIHVKKFISIKFSFKDISSQNFIKGNTCAFLTLQKDSFPKKDNNIDVDSLQQNILDFGFD